MEKEEGEGPGDDGSREEAPPPSDERAILRYEEHITGLLLTVAQLHGRLERLQHQRDQDRGSREEEEEEEEEEVSDFCSEYMASLPRGCLLPFPAAILAPEPPLPSREASAPDLFLAVDEAVASLEKTVFCHQRRIPSAQAELEGDIQAAEGLEETPRESRQGQGERLSQEPGAGGLGPPPGFLAEGATAYEREIAACKERNAALWLELAARKEELRHSEAALGASREERDKLQRKAKELQKTLSEAETLADGAARSIWGWDVGAFHTGPPVSPGEAPLAPPPAVGTPGTRQQQLRSSIETLQRLNQLLSAALRESKSEMEGLSMVLARQESNHSALHLAEHYSECCLEAYEVLWGLTQAEQGLSVPGAKEERDDPHAGASGWPCQEVASTVMERARRALDGFPPDKEEACSGGGVCSGESGPGATEDEKGVLRRHIRQLRMQQAALKLPAPCQPSAPASIAVRIHTAIRAKVAAVHRATQDALPAMEGPTRTEEVQQLQKLQATREVLADLNACLHLAEKENRALELQLYTSCAQEAVMLLMVRILQGERNELRGQGSASSSSSSSPSSSSRNSDSEEYGPSCGAKRSVSGSAGDAEGTGPSPEPETQVRELSCVLARIQVLKERIRSLLAGLEEGSQEIKAQEAQQVELTWDVFTAHRALVLAYLNAQKKQDTQLYRLETQVGRMRQCQAGQLEKLRQALRELEDKRGSGGGVGVLPTWPAFLRNAPPPKDTRREPSILQEGKTEATLKNTCKTD